MALSASQGFMIGSKPPPPFPYYYETFRLCETFFRNFSNVPKESSFQFFDILQQKEC